MSGFDDFRPRVRDRRDHFDVTYGLNNVWGYESVSERPNVSLRCARTF